MGHPKVLESWRNNRKETRGQFLVDNSVVSKCLRLQQKSLGKCVFIEGS